MAIFTRNQLAFEDKQDALYAWEGFDRNRRKQRGEMRAVSPIVVEATLRRQGISMIAARKKKRIGGGKIKLKDMMTFSRQLGAMLRAGLPLVQAVDIVSQGHPNPAMGRLLTKVRKNMEQGDSFSNSLRKHPAQFNALYCDLVQSGEASGALETIIERLAEYQEKSYNLRKKIKGALTYPIAVIVVANIVVAIMMIFVVPVFAKTFSSFGAQLPLPTQIVVAISHFMVHDWWILFGSIGAVLYFFIRAWKRSVAMQNWIDAAALKLPVFGNLISKGSLARWARTMATMFEAGVPISDALDAVGSASGNAVYRQATDAIGDEVMKGTSLKIAMESTGVFPKLFLQMAQIGEETGSIGTMMSKIADFFEQEVDEITKNLSSLMEPFIISVLGIVVGGLVVALYLPIFELGKIVH